MSPTLTQRVDWLIRNMPTLGWVGRNLVSQPSLWLACYMSQWLGRGCGHSHGHGNNPSCSHMTQSFIHPLELISSGASWRSHFSGRPWWCCPAFSRDANLLRCPCPCRNCLFIRLFWVFTYLTRFLVSFFRFLSISFLFVRSCLMIIILKANVSTPLLKSDLLTLPLKPTVPNNMKTV